MQYFYLPNSHSFYVNSVHANIPDCAFPINDQQHAEFFDKQASGKYAWAFDTEAKGFIYTEIAIDHEEIAKKQRIKKAKTLLIESDHQVLPDKFKNYSSEKQLTIIE